MTKKIIFKSISFCRPIKGITSSYGIWLNDIDGKNKMSPLAYMRKPKWLTDKQYKEIMERVINTFGN